MSITYEYTHHTNTSKYTYLTKIIIILDTSHTVAQIKTYTHNTHSRTKAHFSRYTPSHKTIHKQTIQRQANHHKLAYANLFVDNNTPHHITLQHNK
jgi:hypothetical protein